MKHYPECWRSEDHPSCRLAEIVRLQAEVRRLTNGGWPARDLGVETWDFDQAARILCGSETVWAEPENVLTHEVALPMHGPGPTWAQKVCDEPPAI